MLYPRQFAKYSQTVPVNRVISTDIGLFIQSTCEATKNLINSFLIRSSVVIWLVLRMTLKLFWQIPPANNPLRRKVQYTCVHPWPLPAQASLVPRPFATLGPGCPLTEHSSLVCPSGCFVLGLQLFSVYTQTLWVIYPLWLQLISGWFL